MQARVFDAFQLSGDAEDIGYQHGQLLAPRIETNLDFYLSMFGLAQARLWDLARDFKTIITEFNPDYADEIKALAAGAGVDERYIFVLNARSEIYNSTVAECTVLWHQNGPSLAQNWDWYQAAEALTVLLRIERADGHRITMLTEAGIIGKIGMNSAGLGVCLNILRVRGELRGVPVHILLRAMLDSCNLEQVVVLKRRAGLGKASHVLVADAAGNSLSLEFAGEQSFEIKPQRGTLVHSNHYLEEAELDTGEPFTSTLERYDCAREALDALGQQVSVGQLQELLLNQDLEELSINRAYSNVSQSTIGPVGTVFSIVMELAKGRLHVHKGPQDSRPFYTLEC
ncbi:MAG: C45 family autoproteolytic acyltransferase/hydrolase [Gammaproteobacteria bacterium]|nr:C45 family autoproteolytic acyltransferase/hydrolase [Gammaproteobacteria bacterium]